MNHKRSLVTIQKAPKTILQRLITSDIFFVVKIILLKRKIPSYILDKGMFLEKSPKKLFFHLSRKKETCYEIIMIFRGVGQIFSFLLLKFAIFG
jgi:hypothetical protein